MVAISQVCTREFKMKLQKMFTGLAIVATLLLAGAAMANGTPTNNGVNGYGHNTSGICELGSGSAVGTYLAVENVSMIRIPDGAYLAMDITPFTTASSDNSSAIALRFDSNFDETFTVALTSSGDLTLPGRWTITSSDGSDTAAGSDTSAVAVAFPTNITGVQGSGSASATFAYNGASGEYNGATTSGTVATKWANAPVTNIGLTVTDIDMNTAAIPNNGITTGKYTGTLTFTISTGF
jgi:hypothetical protein